MAASLLAEAAFAASAAAEVMATTIFFAAPLAYGVAQPTSKAVQVAALFAGAGIHGFFLYKKCSDLDVRGSFRDKLFELNDLGKTVR